MRAPSTKLDRLKFCFNLIALNLLALIVIAYIFRPSLVWPSHAAIAAHISAPPPLPKTVTAGRPTRIVIDTLHVDLPVDEGFFNAGDQTWTLSADHAQFAIPSMPANNSAGNTLIYGHYNRHVFEPLTGLKPGDIVKVFTDTGHTFTYSYQDSQDVKPDNMTVFEYQGAPRLTIQTCSGNWFEWRRMYRFNLDKVDS